MDVREFQNLMQPGSKWTFKVSWLNQPFTIECVKSSRHQFISRYLDFGHITTNHWPNPLCCEPKPDEHSLTIKLFDGEITYTLLERAKS